MNDTNNKPATTDAASTAPDADQKPDIQLFNAGQTIELLSQLLGACVRKLCVLTEKPDGAVLIHEADIAELDGFELQHGFDPKTGAIVVKVGKAESPAETVAAR